MWQQVVGSAEPGSYGAYVLWQVLFGAAIGIPITIWFIRTLVENTKRNRAHKAWKREQERLRRGGM